ncbi:MAG: DUF4170 domain-containing protein [Rhodospirillales bacterium]|nr:DUF4170 domain-containing protein [Alphaproteobacteria bacterium]MBL6947781.1 DUF4170 domain-containing protein [Rhodospirillales bacterium]
MDKPLLHLVFGGEVEDPQGENFVHPDALDVIGIFPNYDAAVKAWRGASQSRVDEANVKYVIVHLHRMLDPEHPVKFHERANEKRVE